MTWVKESHSLTPPRQTVQEAYHKQELSGEVFRCAAAPPLVGHAGLAVFARLLLRVLEQWKQDHVADRGGIAQEHAKAVDADSFACCGRHTVF